MFLGHIAVGLAGKRAAPTVSLATWLTSVQLVDMLWPIFLLAGLEHVRVAPGITRFTPLDFYDYPITHSLVGSIVWAAIFSGGCLLWYRNARIALLLGAGVVSHWVLDVISHRPDMPVLPRGPYIGLGLWNSVAATLVVELTMFAIGLMLYVRGGGAGRRRVSFWLLMAFVLVAYFAAAFGPPPPNVRTLAWSGLIGWLLVPWTWFADRETKGTNDVHRHAAFQS
jgi:LexA-binding, inner membrane-associated putative hydrolase